MTAIVRLIISLFKKRILKKTIGKEFIINEYDMPLVITSMKEVTEIEHFHFIEFIGENLDGTYSIMIPFRTILRLVFLNNINYRGIYIKKL